MYSKKEQSPYKTLGVMSNSTEEQIKAAYREKALKVHPDKARLIFQQHPEKHTNLAELEQKLVIKFQKLKDAYDILLERVKNSEKINTQVASSVATSYRNKITNPKLVQLMDFLNTLRSTQICSNNIFTYIDPNLLKDAITDVDNLAVFAFETKLNSEKFVNLIACLTVEYLKALVKKFWKSFHALPEDERNDPHDFRKEILEQRRDKHRVMQILLLYINLLKESGDPVPFFFDKWLIKTLWYNQFLIELDIKNSIISAIKSCFDNFDADKLNTILLLSVYSIISKYEQEYGVNLLSTLEDNHLIKILSHSHGDRHISLLKMLPKERLKVILQKMSAKDFYYCMRYSFDAYHKLPLHIQKIFFVEFFDKINPFDFRNYFNDQYYPEERKKSLNSIVLQYAFLAQNKDPLLALYYSPCQATVRDYCEVNGKQDVLNNCLNKYESDLKQQIISDLTQLSFLHRGDGVKNIVIMAQEGQSWNDIVNECKARKNSFWGWLHTIPFFRLFSPRTFADHLLYSVISDFDNNLDNYTKVSNLNELLYAYQKNEILENLESLCIDLEGKKTYKYYEVKRLGRHVKESISSQNAYDTVEDYLNRTMSSTLKPNKTNRDSLFEIGFFRESTTKIKINELLDKVKSEMTFRP